MHFASSRRGDGEVRTPARVAVEVAERGDRPAEHRTGTARAIDLETAQGSHRSTERWVLPLGARQLVLEAPEQLATSQRAAARHARLVDATIGRPAAAA